MFSKRIATTTRTADHPSSPFVGLYGSRWRNVLRGSFYNQGSVSSETEEDDEKDKRIRKNENWHQTSSGKSSDIETIADLDKWIKTSGTEPPVSSNIDLDTTKVLEGMDRYLEEEDLGHSCFFNKDPYGLSIDIDLADTKKHDLSTGYDSLLQDLSQSENRLLEPPCEKVVDEFMLPEFHLDHLDPLTALSSDDMIVAGEILPSTSSQSTINVENQDIEENASKTEILEDNSEKSTTKINIENANKMEITLNQQKIMDQSSGSSSELFVEALESVKEDSSNFMTNSVQVDSQDIIIEQLKSKTRIKFEPRIIKKHRQVKEKLEKKLDKPINGGNVDATDSQDNVMTVVAISTDKISNMTQIVINNGTQKKIIQSKTSELIKATGNFPNLPKIDTSTAAWNGTVEHGTDNVPTNQYEIVISNALEELGITDDSLQPVRITEHDKVWLCPRDGCNRQFGRLYTLKGHLLAHYGVRPFKCDFEECGWAFYSEFKLKRHKETHLKRKDHVCEVCNRRFTTVYNLWSHEKLHSRPNRIVCQVPECGEKFQTKRALELHMKSHDQRHAPYVCQHEGCGKRYYSSNALTSHQRSHSYKEVDIKCSWPGCGKVFDKPCRLKAHIRSHTGCKPYHCTFHGCMWSFSSSSKLKRHQKKHTNERKFVCDTPGCGKAFMRSEHLKEHRLTHTEGRYFQCFVCDARFSAKSSLYVHIKKHQQTAKTDLNMIGNNTTTGCTTSGLKRARTKESHGSQVKSSVKTKAKSKNVINVPKNVATENVVEKLNVTPDNATFENQDQLKWFHRCPIEMCGHLSATETNLREHMLKAHDILDDDSLNNSPPNAGIDYILYTVHSSPSSPAAVTEEQMVMVSPCNAVILGTSSDCCLPEPEPPPFNNLMKNVEPLRAEKQIHKDTVLIKKDQRSARTDLTYSDWSKLKKTGAVVDSLADSSDVVLDASSDMSEGLLLTEELPSMYYQDDAVGTEYQVLLLDSNPLESTG
ncbi:uncharacterized protein LOC109860105 [Pseudomyrmex gracilis]|uniref:uncharacterized protein LOC109860105 n=1 Tax=Pseudomyrmex gracilis TaxID=219809 RepID=UPI0009959EAF|nr:uncharacterized protein LOC109860105 [Pseudomyrmex gracilis]XP_020294566.1 uncharacterized protein LOC109860105 [Pseudomyrmex gracilis]